MIIIKYEASGVAISDFEIDKWIDDVCKYANNSRSVSKGNGYPFAISSYTPLLALFLAVAEGRLNSLTLQLLVNGERVPIDSNGAVHMPKSYKAIDLDLSRQLVTARMENMKVAAKRERLVTYGDEEEILL